MCLYIVPGAPTLFYQQGNHNSCILSSLASALNYMGDIYASEYIIKRKQKYFWRFRIKVECTSAMIFLWDTTEGKTKKYSIIVLRNSIHPHHMIYLGISILIHLCVCHQTRGTGPIIVLEFSANGSLIPILKWSFYSHRIA